MIRIKFYRYLLLVFLVAMFAVTVVDVSVAEAPKQQNLPNLYITQIDTSKFPDVKIWVYGDNLGMPLDSLRIILKEDDVEQSVIAQQMLPVGVQVAFVLDDYAVVDTSLPTQSVQRLAMTGILSPETDRFAVFELADGGVANIRKQWSPDITSIPGALGGYRQTETDMADTNLFDTVSYVLSRFADVDSPGTIQKIVVLFSSGKDTHSAKKIDDVIHLAQANHVKFYTVLIGKYSQAGEANLRRLADITNGQYFQPSVPADLDALWNNLALQRNQLMLEYRSAQPRPEHLSVIAYAGETRIESPHKRFPLLKIGPAQIAIPQIVTDTLIIERHAEAYNTPVSEMQPISFTVPISYFWTDRYTRTVTKLAYVFDDKQYEAETEDRVVLPLANLKSNDTFLQIVATDELGIENSSNSIPVHVVLIYPPRPIWRMALWGIGVLVIIFSIGGSGYIWWQKRAARREKQVVIARLELVRDALSRSSHLPQMIELHRGETRIGRDMTWANVIVDHPKISGKHCIILEESEGVFRIKDANSRNGTFVNQGKKLEPWGYILKNGDEIRLATVVYRFSMIAGSKPPRKSDGDPRFLTEDTNALF